MKTTSYGPPASRSAPPPWPLLMKDLPVWSLYPVANDEDVLWASVTQIDGHALDNAIDIPVPEAAHVTPGSGHSPPPGPRSFPSTPRTREKPLLTLDFEGGLDDDPPIPLLTGSQLKELTVMDALGPDADPAESFLAELESINLDQLLVDLEPLIGRLDIHVTSTITPLPLCAKDFILDLKPVARLSGGRYKWLMSCCAVHEVAVFGEVCGLELLHGQAIVKLIGPANIPLTVVYEPALSHKEIVFNINHIKLSDFVLVRGTVHRHIAPASHITDQEPLVLSTKRPVRVSRWSHSEEQKAHARDATARLCHSVSAALHHGARKWRVKYLEAVLPMLFSERYDECPVSYWDRGFEEIEELCQPQLAYLFRIYNEETTHFNDSSNALTLLVQWVPFLKRDRLYHPKHIANLVAVYIRRHAMLEWIDEASNHLYWRICRRGTGTTE
ncbi:hypothetical protein L227DRAFT_618129 [Lentinus tigrinus ALCF2SS1-6]|uniref:Uncharacterized protein n=1 Tax=Lentinus tigrinus ALCF2SS1-6 TaxID=1328759 RepID=A0A5C2RL66_9APHY|nr:hypothetical protein L227DRAFT_618129 [Lentinus tigrinus ALCF2SS1-6]